MDTLRLRHFALAIHQDVYENVKRLNVKRLNVLRASFTPATIGEVRNTIKSPNKFRDRNPFPTILLEACLDLLFGLIIIIINASLRSGTFPDDFKQVHVNPLVQKKSFSQLTFSIVSHQVRLHI